MSDPVPAVTFPDPLKRVLIERVINAAENGTPENDYSAISLLHDGPLVNGRRIVQITYGARQTTEFSHLKALLGLYVRRKGKFADYFEPYLSKVGDLHNPLAGNGAFVAKLKAAGADPVMQSAQDDLFKWAYWDPAEAWFHHQGFSLPFSMLVIFDSFIQSGSILAFLRASFAARPPAAGGDEKEWIGQYLHARHDWLANNPRQLLRNSSYRTRAYLRILTVGDWELERLPIVMNGVAVNLPAEKREGALA
jgi:chitosanase